MEELKILQKTEHLHEARWLSAALPHRAWSSGILLHPHQSRRKTL